MTAPGLVIIASTSVFVAFMLFMTSGNNTDHEEMNSLLHFAIKLICLPLSSTLAVALSRQHRLEAFFASDSFKPSYASI